jgi:2-hydroxychromene-2-carboxylate isomerase
VSKSIDFFFDFTSPYSYIAAERIEAIAEKGGRTVNYCPTLLGFIFKEIGGGPLTAMPRKGEYSLNDFSRTARFYDLELNFPKAFPANTVMAARAALMVKALQPELLGRFVREVFRAYFVSGQDITQASVIGVCASAAGVDANAALQANDDPRWKDALKAAVQQSHEVKMFGAPYFVVDGEAFWGNDRLDQVERWVKDGPF